MSNSPLVNYTKISPNRSSPRNHMIDTITIHCVVGQLSVEALGAGFAATSRKASSNYGIGVDGRIGMFVEEKDRSWCSSNRANDNRAITIEVASDNFYPYAVNSKAYAALIELCADICKRNNIKELKWKADKSLVGQVDKQNMTAHRWFASTECPGQFLYTHFDDIAAKVNAKLGVKEESTSAPVQDQTQTTSTYAVGDTIKLINNAVYNTGKAVPSWVKARTLYIRRVYADGSIDFSIYKTGGITGTVAKNQIAGVSENSQQPILTGCPYLARVTVDALNVRKGPGLDYGINTIIRNKGIYTIVEEKNGFGKLKSGAGWIQLTNTVRTGG